MSIASSRRGHLLAVWLVLALMLGALLLATQLRRGPLHDPNLAYERPGFLDAHGAPFPAPQLTPVLPAPGERTVVFFTRPQRAARLLTALAQATSLHERAQLVVMVAGPTVTGSASDIPVVADPDGERAAGFRMPRPRDDGSPVGYAIVDSRGQVRYRTLDPAIAEHLTEVDTMVRATP